MAALVALLLAPALAERARAMCDAIPGVTQEFRGAVGTLSRPFAIPNDDGEQIAIRLHPGVCEPEGAGFVDLPGGLAPEDDYFVTLLFEPPGDAARNAVVLATAANLALCQQRVAGAGALPNGGTATCVASSPNPLEPPLLSIRGECVGGSRSGQRCSDAAECVDAGCLPVVLRFRFPDTDALVGASDDDRTLTGPATVAATPVSAPLPFGLATARCADTPGLVACIDELFARDGTCATGPDHVDPTFGRFTALPPPNDYQGLCVTTAPDGPCEPGRIPPEKRELRFAVDAAGNALVPMDYRGVLVHSDRIPIPRLLLGGTALEAFSGGGGPVQLPVDGFLASYAPGGQRLPPLFEPLHNPEATAELSLFGSVDAAIGVIRVQRRGCIGGPSEGSSCEADAECGAGASCQTLFDFSDRLVAGVGPVVIPSPDFALQTQNPVPLDGLNQTASLFAFVTSEAISQAPQSLNDDADQTDPVLQLRDRTTSAVLPIGTNGKPARAVTRIRDGRFRHPAVATEGDLVAFLELEPLEGERDANANGSVFDPILRLYRVRPDCGGGQPCAESLLSESVAVDPNPLVAGRTVAISDGVVYFRTPEWRQAQQQTELVSVSTAGGPANDASRGPALSADGRVVAFKSNASDLVDAPDNGFDQVYVHDRNTKVTERASVGYDGQAGDASSAIQDSNVGFIPIVHSDVAISGDGRLVAFNSLARNLVPGDTNQRNDVFVRDRTDSTTTRVSVGVWGEQLNTSSASPSLSSDGRFVGFVSGEPYGYGLNAPRYVVRDRWSLKTIGLASGFTPDWWGGGRSRPFGPVASNDGRLFAINGLADLPGENGWPYSYLYDVVAGTLEIVSLDSEGLPREGSPPLGLSADGSAVTFVSNRSLVPGDTNSCYWENGGGCRDVYVRDRRVGTTERMSVRSDGSQVDLAADQAQISADGKTFAFRWTRGVPRLLPLPWPFDIIVYYPTSVIALHDRLTAATEVISTESADTDGPAVSRDGTTVSYARDGQIWARGPSASDSSADLSGDGDVDDVVLGAVDTTAPSPTPIAWLRPVSKVVVAAGAAAFLDDAGRVHLTDRGGTPVDLGKDANDLAMSDQVLAARVPAADGGEAFVEVCDWPSRAACWQSVGARASAIDASGPVVAFLTSECPFEQPTGQLCPGDGSSWNGDIDTEDRVLRVYRADSDRLIDTGQAAEEFVLGERLVAFRTREAAQSRDLNGDGDQEDGVLQVFDLVSERLFNTGNAVTPCPLEACDPRFPYQARGDTVVYLTAEAEQGGRDLNGDGDALDLVKQVFNAREAEARLLAGEEATEAVQAIASASAGVCTTTGDACATDADCGAGTCHLPPGACIADLGTPCSCGATGCTACPTGQFCEPTVPGGIAGTCRQEQGPCASRIDCTDPRAICRSAEADIQRLFAPVAPSGAESEAVYSSGTCVEDSGKACAADADCGTGELCGTAGSCERRAGSCLTDDDCADGLVCAPNLIVAAAADSDGDDLIDPVDNCPSAPNVDQADLDGDGVGDACDADLEGDGVVDAVDNCPGLANPDQADLDGDETGDACDADDDSDDVPDAADNCARVANRDQADFDRDGSGDACDADDDDDGIPDATDNCGLAANLDQADFDRDGVGDACDGDRDGDGVANTGDRCADSPRREKVDAQGCTAAQMIAQLCPRSGFSQHGRYVSCIAHAAQEAVKLGLIRPSEKSRFVAEAARGG